MAIQWGSNILNDSLYLGVKNGAVHMIIPTGAELPYTSSVMTGFKIEPGQNKIAIPIKSRNLDGSYRKIANGNISFRENYRNGAYVAFKIFMGRNKVITMQAWTSKDIEGYQKVEEGFVEIAIDNSETVRKKGTMAGPQGSILQARAEINNIYQLCKNQEKSKNRVDKGNISKRISSCVDSICGAGNKEDFAETVLEKLAESSLEEFRLRLFIIARKIGTTWKDTEKRQLGEEWMKQIGPELAGLS